MFTTTRINALIACALAGSLAACATADADPAPAPAPSATTPTTPARPTEPRAVPAIPAELTLQPTAKPGDPTSNAVINDCACLDFSQICDCRSGTCYGYYETSQKDGPYACYEGSTFLYNYYCTHYERYTGC